MEESKPVWTLDVESRENSETSGTHDNQSHGVSPSIKENQHLTETFEMEVLPEGAESYVNWRRCTKNKGHRDFIPTSDFTIQHLPEPYRTQEYFEIIKLMSALTVRLIIKCTSSNRPDSDPFAKNRGSRQARTGSGIVLPSLTGYWEKGYDFSNIFAGTPVEDNGDDTTSGGGDSERGIGSKLLFEKMKDVAADLGYDPDIGINFFRNIDQYIQNEDDVINFASGIFKEAITPFFSSLFDYQSAFTDVEEQVVIEELDKSAETSIDVTETVNDSTDMLTVTAKNVKECSDILSEATEKTDDTGDTLPHVLQKVDENAAASCSTTEKEHVNEKLFTNNIDLVNLMSGIFREAITPIISSVFDHLDAFSDVKEQVLIEELDESVGTSNNVTETVRDGTDMLTVTAKNVKERSDILSEVTEKTDDASDMSHVLQKVDENAASSCTIAEKENVNEKFVTKNVDMNADISCTVTEKVEDGADTAKNVTENADSVDLPHTVINKSDENTKMKEDSAGTDIPTSVKEKVDDSTDTVNEVLHGVNDGVDTSHRLMDQSGNMADILSGLSHVFGGFDTSSKGTQVNDTSYICNGATAKDEIKDLKTQVNDTSYICNGATAKDEIKDLILRHRIEPCPCPECKASESPQPVGYCVLVYTARHVIFDDNEAENTVLDLFFDDKTGKNVEHLYGLKMFISDSVSDFFTLICVTHNQDLFRRLHKMRDRFSDLLRNLPDNNNPPLTVISSHPHGMFKHITVGQWTKRWLYTRLAIPPFIHTSYEYDTPTCPGSSGAPVLILGQKENTQKLYSNPHPHYGCLGGKINRSGVHTDTSMRD